MAGMACALVRKIKRSPIATKDRVHGIRIGKIRGRKTFTKEANARLLLDSGLMADHLCNYPSEIDMDGRMFGGEHLGSPLRSPERRGESCIRSLCPIRPYAQKLRLHRAILLSGYFLFFVHVSRLMMEPQRHKGTKKKSFLSVFVPS